MIRGRREFFFISERLHNTCRIKNNNKNKRINNNNKKNGHRIHPHLVWFRKKEEPAEEREDRESAFTPRLKVNQRRLERKEPGPKADLEP